MAYQSVYGQQEYETRVSYATIPTHSPSTPESFRDPILSCENAPAYQREHLSHLPPSRSYPESVQSCRSPPEPSKGKSTQSLESLFDPSIRPPGAILRNDPRLPEHRRFNSTFRNDGKCGSRSARQIEIDYQHVKALRNQIPIYQKYRLNCDKNAETPGKEGEAKWPPEKEEVFWRCIAEFPPMGKDKERLTPDGKRLGRMEMIAVGTASVLGPECFVQPPPKTPNQAQTKKSQDQELPRKHISSHSQVAKKKFYVEADDPKFWNDQDWVDKDSEEHKNVKRIVLWWLGAYEDKPREPKLGDKTKERKFSQELCPKYIIDQLNEHCGRRPLPWRFRDIRFEPQKFHMTIRGPPGPTKRDDYGPVIYNFTPYPPRELPCFQLDETQDWPRHLEPLAQMHYHGRLSANVLVVNASVDVPSKFDYHQARMVIENRLFLPAKGDWHTRTQFYTGARLYNVSQVLPITDTEEEDDAGRRVYNARLGDGASDYWARTFSEFWMHARSPMTSQQAQDILDKRVQSFTALQEIFDFEPRKSLVCPLLVICWTFKRTSPGVGGSLTWRELIPPSVPTNEGNAVAVGRTETAPAITSSSFSMADFETEVGLDTVSGTLSSADSMPYYSPATGLSEVCGGPRDRSIEFKSSDSSRTVGRTEDSTTPDGLVVPSSSVSFLDPELSEDKCEATNTSRNSVVLPGLGHIPQGQPWLSQYMYPGAVASQYSTVGEPQHSDRYQALYSSQSGDTTHARQPNFFEVDGVASKAEPADFSSLPQSVNVPSSQTMRVGFQDRVEAPERHQCVADDEAHQENHQLLPAFDHPSPLENFFTHPEIFSNFESFPDTNPSEFYALSNLHDTHQDQQNHHDFQPPNQLHSLHYDLGNADNSLHYTSQRLQQHQSPPIYPENPYLHLLDAPHFLRSQIPTRQQEQLFSTQNPRPQQPHSHMAAQHAYNLSQSQNGSEMTTPTEALSFDCGEDNTFGGFPTITLMSQSNIVPQEHQDDRQNQGCIVGEVAKELKDQDMEIDDRTSAGGDWTTIDHPSTGDWPTGLSPSYGVSRKDLTEEQQALAAAFDPELLEADNTCHLEEDVETGASDRAEPQSADHQQSSREAILPGTGNGELLPSALD